MTVAGDYVSAVKEFIYTDTVIERGEIFQLQGLRNDNRMVDITNHALLTKPTTQFQCDACSKRFADGDSLNIHYYGRIHPESPNYGGPAARSTLEAPTARQETLAVRKGGQSRGNTPIFGGR